MNPDEFRDPPAPGSPAYEKMPHRFPYGSWFDDPPRDPNSHIDQWDLDGGDLPANGPSIPSQPLVPYPVYVEGSWNPETNVDALFKKTCGSSSFTYLPNPNKLAVHWDHKGLRVIKMPYPTRIIPATFRHDATIQATAKGGPPGGFQQTTSTSRDSGFATNHIFEYEGASAVSFLPPNPDSGKPSLIALSAGTGSGSDLHFHVLPTDYKEGHDKEMFNIMLCAIDSGLADSLTLKVGPCPPPPITKGALVPVAVSDRELEITPPPAQCPRSVDPATCCSGGIGLGGGN